MVISTRRGSRQASHGGRPILPERTGRSGATDTLSSGICQEFVCEVRAGRSGAKRARLGTRGHKWTYPGRRAHGAATLPLVARRRLATRWLRGPTLRRRGEHGRDHDRAVRVALSELVVRFLGVEVPDRRDARRGDLAQGITVAHACLPDVDVNVAL